MARKVQVTDNVYVIYNYPNENYEIYNKTLYTTRLTVEDTIDVVTILVPTLTPTQLAQLKTDLTALAETLETLTSLSFTYADTGECVQTIQINTYDKYPLTLDLAKQKLYIMNSNIIFDLTLNEFYEHRLNLLKDYYKRTLGLDLTLSDLKVLYDFLLSYYAPHPYNKIPTLTNSNTTITYSNIINFSNPTSSSKVTYTITMNPNSSYTYPIEYYIKAINSNRVLALTAEPTTLEVGQSIVIDNTTTVVDESTSYNSNGTYTISAIDEDNSYVKVKESLAQYETTYKACYLKQPVLSIDTISRNDKTITCTTAIPNSILIGDTVYVEGTTQTINYQEVSVDGSYTVYEVEDSTITTEETPLTNYTHDTTYANLSKHVSLGNILSIKDNVVTVSGTVPTGITGLIVVIDDTEYTIKAIDTINKTITLNETIEDYTPDYGYLEVAKPVEETQVEVLTSNTDTLPTGKFLLDTYEETVKYLALGTAYLPSTADLARGGQVLIDEISLTGCSVDKMVLKGLYSQIYS